MEFSSDEDNSIQGSSKLLTPKKKRLHRGGDALKTEKQGHRDQKFRTEWCLNPQFKLWLKPVIGDVYRAKCLMCNKDFKSDKSVIKNHANSAKHKLMLTNSKPKSQQLIKLSNFNCQENCLCTILFCKIPYFFNVGTILSILLSGKAVPSSNYTSKMFIGIVC